MNRCSWAEKPEIYVQYHDTEWGVPVRDDRRHFEFLTLETFQSGLSWLTILRKREAFRRAFDGFDPARVAAFAETRVSVLLGDAEIVRNRAKIGAAVGNARAFIEVQREFGSFDAYYWRFSDGIPIVNRWRSLADIPCSSALSESISGDLRARGFRFVGPTVIYSHMQATGMVNDHLIDCFRHAELSGVPPHAPRGRARAAAAGRTSRGR